MTYYVLRVLISAVVVVVVSQVAKRSSLLGGFIASLPLISILVFIWLYLDTRSLEKIGALSYSILWLMLPSLLKKTGSFYLSLGGAVTVMFGLYIVTVVIPKRFDATP